MLPHPARCAALLVSLLAGGCAGGEGSHELRTDTFPILGGTPEERLEAVASVRIAHRDSLCSGVLVAPDAIVTAAHCILGVEASEVEVRFGSTSTPSDAAIAPSAIVPYPGATGSAEEVQEGGVDLALLLLGNPVGVAPIGLGRGGAPPEGTALTIAGFGQSSEGTSGTRMTAETSLTRLCSRLLVFGDESANACTGDSGGAVLSHQELVGIISHGRSGCTGPTFATRLDIHLGWVDAVLGAGGPADCPDGCMTPVADCSLLPPSTSGDGGGAVPEAPTGGGDSSCSVREGGMAPRGWALVLVASLLVLSRLARFRRGRPSRNSRAASARRAIIVR